MILAIPPQTMDYYSQTELCISNREEDKNTNFEFIYNTINKLSATSHITSVKNRITEIGILKDNWDGYGASKPIDKVINNSFRFIDAIFKNDFKLINQDDITPTPYGTISFDFISEKGLVSVEIGVSKLGFFTDFLTDDNVYYNEIDTDFCSIPDALNKALIKL